MSKNKNLPAPFAGELLKQAPPVWWGIWLTKSDRWLEYNSVIVHYPDRAIAEAHVRQSGVDGCVARPFTEQA